MSSRILREATEKLLCCGDDHGAMKRSVDQLYALFSQITGVKSDDLNDEHIFLASGKAISPACAAFCLKEYKRTTVFIRGIDEAIMQKIAEHGDRKISILYAGTGPYGTLLVPLLSLFSPEKIVVDLLEINSMSLNAVQKLIGALQLDPFIGKVYNCDAAVFTMERDYDIVISETMQAALKKEPQVAIMQNLIPQMARNSVFIPQSIAVKAIIAPKSFNINKAERSIVEKELGCVAMYNLNFNTEVIEFGPTTETENNVSLLLTTTITVYDNHILENGDCTITFPVRVCTVQPGQSGRFTFWYENGSLPGFRCRFNDEEKVYEAVGRAIAI